MGSVLIHAAMGDSSEADTTHNALGLSLASQKYEPSKLAIVGKFSEVRTPACGACRAYNQDGRRAKLRASNMRGAAEVLAVLGLGQPGGLTGGLARAPTRSGRAIPLTLAIAIAIATVEIEKQPAAQALAL